MPPQAGFVSEWYMFETVFQGFRLDTLPSRLVMALAGAGLALTVAVAFATYVKAFGIGLLGRTSRQFPAVRPAIAFAVGVLGLGVLALAVGMPVWLDALRVAVYERIRHPGGAGHARRAAAGAADRQVRLHLADPAGRRHAAPGAASRSSW